VVNGAGDVEQTRLRMGLTVLRERTMSFDLEGDAVSGTDEQGRVLTWSNFTSRGQPQLVTMTLPGAVGLPTLETDITYDVFGRVLSRKDRQTGAEQTFQYDGIGRVLQRSTRAAPSPDEVWDYVYQPGKNELRIKETLASEQYTKETHTIDGLRESESWNFA